ncbi:MAG: branched chain amino acid aminotransferase [Chloroflexi bacterium HGW-Chloroflexi-4]|jgi:branched-chain amino acid aminotransferase|nr:MAG: branched chain amino acid aminotransferase [Chloroflexi bacterium HGW-Chloroflexi-4]
MSNESKFIWMDGELIEFEKATVPFLTSALHYGSAVFEGIRCYKTDKGPAVFRLKEHMERLVDSAMVLGFQTLPYTAEELGDAVKKTIRANGFEDCYIRPLIYSGGPVLSLNLDATQAKVGIAVWDMGAYLGNDALENGIRAHISSFTRHHPNVSMTKAKVSGNYANSLLAKTESIRLGFDEAILLDPQGYVAECSGENLFIVRGGTIYTSHTAAILEGITRDSLLTICSDLGYTLKEQPISRDQLYIADELFVCGTAAECIAIREVDFRVIGSGKAGPITQNIQAAFHETLRGKGKHSPEWCAYVN